jgi:hypothetical protein
MAARGSGDWAKARKYLDEHPGATSEEIWDHAHIKNKNAAYQVLAAAKRKAGKTAADGLAKFSAVRENLKKKGRIPSGFAEVIRPFRVDFMVDDRGIEIFLGDNGRKKAIGTLEITAGGLVFVRGKALRSTEREIPWDLLASLQNFASNIGGA